MFDVAAYYTAARSGDPVDVGGLLAHLRGFRRVVLWGASFLGQAVARQLGAHGIAVTAFWDLRAGELKRVQDLEVLEPFTGGFDPADTLVLLCIGNTILQPSLSRKLAQAGYHHLLGDHVFMGLGCKASKARGLDPEACLRSMTCRAIYCERLSRIVEHRARQQRPEPLAGPPIFLQSLTVVVNQVCSLKCKFCTSYMNAYAPAERRNVPTARILEDIERCFQAVDSVGSVTVMGGEPFLHPDLGEVVQALLRQPNCGLISISTSGTCAFSPRQLALLRDPRVNVSFSNYLDSLGEGQRERFQQNVAQVLTAGVPHTVGVPMPAWIIPSTLHDRHRTEAELVRKKQDCWPRTNQLKNGKLHPCDLANSVYHLHLADHPGDYVDVAQAGGVADLRRRIRDYLDAPFYRTCGHCHGCGDLTSHAGEQGFQDFLPGPDVAVPE